MAFLAFLCMMSVVDLLRGELIPPKADRPFVRKHKQNKVTIDVDLDEGERILAHLSRSFGSAKAADFLQEAAGNTCGLPLPYGYYRDYITEVLDMQFSRAKRECLRRSFRTYARATATGAITRVALRGFRKYGSIRGGKGEHNSIKCPGLS